MMDEHDYDIADPGTWRVMVVEDNADNLELVYQLLEFYSAEIFVAYDGAAGMGLLENILPTVLLLDLSMPNMNGWQMLTELRANPQTQHIPVIALTAHARREDREQALAYGFDGYISKPISIKTFIPEVQAVLKQCRER